jgi:AcrR family transcriptional regulator
MTSTPPPTLAAAPVQRRNPRHERNRVRLIDAALAILLGDGMASFTSARIAGAAGLHKPAFYSHFKNVDECLQAVALRVAQDDVRDSLLLTQPSRESVVIPEADWVQTLTRVFQNMLDHADVYRVIVRYKHAEGALGLAIRAMDRAVFEHWTEYFWRLAVHYGVDARHFREVAELAEHIVGITYLAGERLLTGRTADVAAEARRIYRYDAAIVSAELGRMLADPPRP